MNEKTLRAVGQVTFLEANSQGDDILVYRSNAENGQKEHVETFYGIRQQVRTWYYDVTLFMTLNP